MKIILRISIAAVVIAAAVAVLFQVGAGTVFTQQTDEPAPFDMSADGDGNGIPDDFENAYREIVDQPEDGDFDFAAIERFEARIPVSDETRRLRDEMDAKTQELLSSTSESRQIELLGEIQELSDRMVQNDPVHSASLEYLDRLESQSDTD